MQNEQQYQQQIPRIIMVLFILLAIGLSACTSTSKVSHSNLAQCQENALEIESHAQQSASKAQYLTAARALNNCLIEAADLNNVQQQLVLQTMAMSTLNYIKGGDVASASGMVEQFKQQYPMQDLYFADYTSFLDTATALLSGDENSSFQLSSLNISRELRQEIERNRYWLTN
jgi:outer membrane protein assembly factor BamD (BamD/ComL family)